MGLAACLPCEALGHRQHRGLPKRQQGQSAPNLARSHTAITEAHEYPCGLLA
nr:hypothetical protein [uncultured Albidiferax sp.]